MAAKLRNPDCLVYGVEPINGKFSLYMYFNLCKVAFPRFRFLSAQDKLQWPTHALWKKLMFLPKHVD